MSDLSQRQDRDLVLPPHTYAFVLDNTKGKVDVYVGPYKNSLSNTDQLVVWDEHKRRVVPSNDLNVAVQTFVTAEEGQYVLLTNPALANSQPQKGNATESTDLQFGRRVVIPGPAAFPLWPGQSANVIDGHHLRHNEYLVVRVYDAEEARANWGNAVVATTSGEDEVTPLANDGLTMGQMHVIKGTDVSFYMPSTGLEVVPDEDGEYVRDAVTLETLEYCLLLDENGEKRYVRGPDVVFPEPTEKFVESKHNDGKRVFQAIELNENSGIYVKVISEYTDGGTVHPVGEELFITGKEQAIYFPRAEHSMVLYGNEKKHHAIAIPAGEGRYVLDRNTGTVDLVLGPKMFLPDPRTEVVVRRILDPHDCEILYPGNAEAQEVNRRYREASSTLSPGEHLASASLSNTLLTNDPGYAQTSSLNYVQDSEGVADALYAASKGVLPDDETTLRRARSGGRRTYAASGVPGKAIARGTTYAGTRTITLDTKYEGAVTIVIWAGYAVLITDRSGNRRVEVGPKIVQLEYDEMVMAMELSTGRPKSDHDVLRTGYLRVANNVVTDIVTVETQDLVSIDIEISYRVNFEGDDPLLWFEVENYVQVLTDHCRSRLRNAAKRSNIREFYTNTIDIARDTLLGAASDEGRVGLAFPENGMRVYDVEVLNVVINNDDVAELLTEAQSTALSGAIRLSIAEEDAEREAKLEEIQRASILEKAATAKVASEVRLAAQEQQLAEALAVVDRDAQLQEKRSVIEEAILAAQRAEQEQMIELRHTSNTVDIERLVAETAEFVKRQQAVPENLIAALQTYAAAGLGSEIVKVVAPAAAATGVTTADMLENLFSGTSLAGVFNTLAQRPLSPANGKTATPVS